VRPRSWSRFARPPDQTAVAPLLLVAFHDLGRSDVSRVGVATGLAQGPPLTQEVPALVEGDPQLLQPPPVVVARTSCCLTLPELVLLGDELLDRSVDLRIVHRSHTTPQLAAGAKAASSRSRLAAGHSFFVS
jgi:hypothetical protein